MAVSPPPHRESRERESTERESTEGGLICPSLTFPPPRYSRFARNESALNLDDKVTGHAVGNSVDGTMFGRYFRPRGFRCSANECTADSGSDGEADGEA